MISDRQRAWLELVIAPGLGPARIQQLIEAFGNPEAAVSSTESQLAATTGWSPELCQAVKQSDPEKLEQSIAWLEQSEQHHILTIDDAQYPALLKSIHGPPPLLFVKGDPAILGKHQLAMVGSRNASNMGHETAYEFARYLAGMGLIITSGLALGIDGASHQGALDAGGQTIAVTGNGLDRVYPARHHEMAHQIAEHGALISEFPPGTRPLPAHFPRRNRIIAGLSLGTLVIEAALKSGSLITAYKALEESREVFAIPGSIHNPLARGCHQLIRQGAKLVETAADVLEELAPMAQASVDMQQAGPAPAEHSADVDQSHQAILDAMEYDVVNIDTLVNRTGFSAGVISSVLLILELQGKVSSQSGGQYLRKQPVIQ